MKKNGQPAETKSRKQQRSLNLSQIDAQLDSDLEEIARPLSLNERSKVADKFARWAKQLRRSVALMKKLASDKKMRPEIEHPEFN